MVGKHCNPVAYNVIFIICSLYSYCCCDQSHLKKIDIACSKNRQKRRKVDKKIKEIMKNLQVQKMTKNNREKTNAKIFEKIGA